MANNTDLTQSIHRGLRLFAELVSSSTTSRLLAETQPRAVDAVLSVHQRMLKNAGIDLPDYANVASLRDVDQSGIAAFYGEDASRQGAFLRLLHDAVKYSAPLAYSHPNKGPREEVVDEVRREMMVYLVDHNPHWLTAYRTSPEGQTRQERHSLAIALGGHSIGATPIERLLASAGEIIDTMEAMSNDSSRSKADLLSHSYDTFADNYAFDPSRIQVLNSTEQTPDGEVTTSRLSFWSTIEQREEAITIKSAPGQEPMSRSQLIEAAAQTRWGSDGMTPEVAIDIARFSRQVLDFSLPEREMSESAGQHMARLSQTLESSLSRYAPDQHESWKRRDVLATRCIPVARTELATYLGNHGLSVGIGSTPFVASTPTDAAQPAQARYLPSGGILIVTEHGSSAGLKAALAEDYPDAPHHPSKYEPREAVSPMQALVDHISATCRYLDQEESKQLAHLLTGHLDPEMIPETADWVARCYHRPSDNELLMHAADALLNSHGVELIRGEDIGDGTSEDLEYVNAGDPYVPTLISHGGSLYLAGQGDMVEALEQRQLDEQEGRDWEDMPIKNPHPMPVALDEMIDKAAGVDREEPTYHRMDDLAM